MNGWPTRSVLLSGFAWACVVTTFESLSQPPLELTMSEFLAFYSRLILHFGLSGILLAWLTSKIGERPGGFPASLAAVPVLAAALATAVLVDWLSVTIVPYWRNDPLTAMWELPAVGVHLAWTISVYGGLYVLTSLFLRKEALTRERLRVAQLARVDAEARMDRALAENMLPAVEPDLLVRALSELARRYDETDGRADRLLDKLVRLLRSAAGPSRDSKLATELGQLRRELEACRPVPMLQE